LPIFKRRMCRLYVIGRADRDLYKKPLGSSNALAVALRWSSPGLTPRRRSVFRRAAPFFVARLVSKLFPKPLSCNSQVTIVEFVIFITDIRIHEAVSDSSVAVIGNRRIAVRGRGAGNVLY